MDIVTLAMAKAYTDQKAGYSKTEELCFLREVMTKSELFSDVEMELPLVPGETYIVTIDGVEQEYVCKEEEGAIYLGDPSFMLSFLDSTGDIFGLVVDAHPYAYIASMDGKAHTISVYQKKETIHTIDPKFIPGAVLPVVELSTTITDGAVFTEEESAQLAAVMGMPCIIKASLDGVDTTSVVCMWSGTADNGSFFFQLSTLIVNIFGDKKYPWQAVVAMG